MILGSDTGAVNSRVQKADRSGIESKKIKIQSAFVPASSVRTRALVKQYCTVVLYC